MVAQKVAAKTGYGATKNERENMKTTLEAQLKRLNVNTTHRRPEGIAVYADDNLPRGWVRLSDGTGTVYGDAAEIAAVLEDVDAEEVTTESWDAVWDALGEFEDNAPTT
jgi:hypothetical protein